MFTITTIITIAIIFLVLKTRGRIHLNFTIENSEECMDFKNSNSIKFLILN